MAFAWQTHIEKATEELLGLLQGVAIDYKLKDVEIAGLIKWKESHQSLAKHWPFSELSERIEVALADGVIDADEREEIMEWCNEINEPTSTTSEMLTDITRRLHGVLQGILVDDEVADLEVRGLYDWLLDYEIFKDSWPFCEIRPLLEAILEDNKITKAERKRVKEYCEQYIGVPITNLQDHDVRKESWAQTDAPHFKPISYICDSGVDIHFSDKLFCFTGKPRTGPKKDLEKLAEERGGLIKSNVTLNLDYLVIGANGDPCWSYSTYGRKIEAVIRNRKKADVNTTIVSEDDFIAAISLE